MVNVSCLTRAVAFPSSHLEAGMDVRFCDLPQIEDPTGRFVLQQMAAVAELEAGLIGDRTKKALADWIDKRREAARKENDQLQGRR